MVITYDSAKRDKTLAERGLDFEDAAVVFEGLTLVVEDIRKDHGEKRFLCLGTLDGEMVVIVFTPRGEGRRIISMRKANDRERKKVGPKIGF